MAAILPQRQALTQLGAATAEAVARTLEMLAPGTVERGEVTVIPDASSPFTGLPEPALAASVSYVDGVTGANIFLMSQPCARALAGAMGVPPEPDGPLSELEMSAVGEAANQTLAAAAAATSVVIGQEIAISPPDVRLLNSTAEIRDIYGQAPYSASTTFTIAGEGCRLIQLVPSAFVVRIARAIEERSFEVAVDAANGGHPQHADARPISVGEALSGTRLRVWAELGRAEMALGEAIELPAGALVELDRTAEAPVDLFVNGLCFGHGRLLITEDGEWAIEVESVTHASLRQTSSLAFAGISSLSEPEAQPILKGPH
ncbi:FliM/FliN family flagellar motor switch protein [Conexibacter sp. DBS9H8]|uniref:FliM/FliN family flagellar motor switch protein n=1 Tax=Conexibacter sp. DBS9H8 TaxID=2937801 RepID=UPI00200F9E61|nr:FliM/FliN family flagellar motor switch protein [Conexibacter sp. DBS9H8]